MVLHDYFGRALMEADGVLFVGFAFRDEYINDVVVRYLRSSAGLAIINPGELSVLPFSGKRVKHLKKPFDAESAKEAMDWLLKQSA